MASGAPWNALCMDQLALGIGRNRIGLSAATPFALPILRPGCASVLFCAWLPRSRRGSQLCSISITGISCSTSVSESPVPTGCAGRSFGPPGKRELPRLTRRNWLRALVRISAASGTNAYNSEGSCSVVGWFLFGDVSGDDRGMHPSAQVQPDVPHEGSDPNPPPRRRG